MIDQTPIYSAMCQYLAEDNLRLHMPGHIGGRGMVAALQSVAALDLTEVPGLDDFHLPRGVIEQSQRLMAGAAGAEESFFLVNGASSGIHALIMSVAGEGEQILLPRNAHRCFYGGMVLSGALPVYLPCQLDAEMGLALSVNCAEVDQCLSDNPKVKAVFITSPSYFGTCSDIGAIVAVSERYHKSVLVDEAHGGHFPFHPAYPAPALQQGAMAAVNGLHKTWPVLNQGACLHLQQGFTEREQLRQAISLLTTTSPSYPLLASIELARLFMEQEGAAQLEKAWLWSREYKEKINRIKGLRCYGDELMDKPGVNGLDPLKVLISIPELGLSGTQLGSILRGKYHIQLELENEQMIMAMFSPLHEKADWERFYLALLETAGRYTGRPKEPLRVEAPPDAKVVLSPRQAFWAAKRQVPLEESRGLISGEMIAAYPPGIPCLLPGERITEAVLDYLYYLRIIDAHIQGPEEPNLKYLRVIDEDNPTGKQKLFK
jgi:arginine decarboxylase